jgi:alginate O-acetyltransferase complex protein AlgI
VLFTSAAYLLLFLPATVALWWTVPARFRLWLLLVASYVFYLSWSPEYGLLLAGSTVVNYLIARRLPDVRRPKRLLAAGVVFNLGVLAYFKYAGLFSESAADLVAWLGLTSEGSFDTIQVLLPLAISFFTFEMISALVDVHRGQTRIGSFLVFATYKAYFPKLLAGPITRYTELAPQLERPAVLTFERFQSGVALFALGLVKKVVLAENFATLADAAFENPGAVSAGTAWLGVLAFGLQIFFDFSAYTDMARGSSRLLGLELPQNFFAPYAATSPSDFWKRWHVTLSRWLRDYLYIPLGGNRKGRVRTYRNLVLTMVLGGLWHGAGWHFAVWGAMHGAMLAVAHALRGRFREPGVALKLTGWALTMTGVFAAWILFRATSLGQAGEVFAAMARFPAELTAPAAISGGGTVRDLLVLSALTFVTCALAPRLGPPARAALERHATLRPAIVGAATLGLWTAAGVLSQSDTDPFIYFRF